MMNLNSLNNKIVGIMYHYVRELKTSKYKKIHFLNLKEFKKQITYFKKKFNMIGIEDIVHLNKDKKIYKKPFAFLSFDDGYIDHYNNVFPILVENKLEGLFYPPTKIFDKNVVLDVNKIQFVLSLTTNKKKIFNEIDNICKKKYNLNLKKINKNKFNFNNRYDNKELILIKNLLQFILPKKIRNEINDYLFKKYVTNDIENFRKKLYLDKNHIREMLSNGMHFGSHSSNHEWMQYLDYTNQEKEIIKSIKFLQKNFNLNKNYYSFCYPYGSFNNDTITLLKKHNFKLGLTTRPMPFEKNKKKDLLKFPRFDTNDFS
jgi:peptidoglycan/xylan/chitin deacetylase (PgdA/CDA1 family)